MHKIVDALGPTPRAVTKIVVVEEMFHRCVDVTFEFVEFFLFVLRYIKIKIFFESQNIYCSYFIYCFVFVTSPNRAFPITFIRCPGSARNRGVKTPLSNLPPSSSDRHCFLSVVSLSVTKAPTTTSPSNVWFTSLTNCTH